MHYAPLVDTEYVAFEHRVMILILMKMKRFALRWQPLLGGHGGPLPG